MLPTVPEESKEIIDFSATRTYIICSVRHVEGKGVGPSKNKNRKKSQKKAVFRGVPSVSPSHQRVLASLIDYFIGVSAIFFKSLSILSISPSSFSSLIPWNVFISICLWSHLWFLFFCLFFVPMSLSMIHVHDRKLKQHRGKWRSDDVPNPPVSDSHHQHWAERGGPIAQWECLGFHFDFTTNHLCDLEKSC